MAMVNFYTSLEEEGFEPHNRELIARNIPEEYRKLMTQSLLSDKDVLVFNTREDIEDLCRQEEKRISEMTGEYKTLNDNEIAAVFIWNKTFGIVSEIPRTVERWTRYFKMDKNSPCIACMDSGKKRTVCSNCVCIICLDCLRKIEDNKCPMCTLEMSSFK